MYCTNCGTKLAKKIKFCPECGSKRFAPSKNIKTEKPLQDGISSTTNSEAKSTPKMLSRKLSIVASFFVILALLVFVVVSFQKAKREKIANILEQAGKNPAQLYEISQRYLTGDELFDQNIQYYKNYLDFAAQETSIRAVYEIAQNYKIGTNGYPQNTYDYIDYLEIGGDLGDPTALYEAGIVYTDGFRDFEPDPNAGLDFFKRTLRAAKAGKYVIEKYSTEYEGARKRILALEPGYFAEANFLIYFTNIGVESAFQTIEEHIPKKVAVHIHDTSSEKRLKESMKRFKKNFNMDLRLIPVINRYSGIFSQYVIVDSKDLHIQGCLKNAEDVVAVLLGDKKPNKCPTAYNKLTEWDEGVTFSQSYKSRFSIGD